MKEIKILIRLNESETKLGFAIERSKGEDLNISEVLKVIGILDIIKQREMEKLTKLQSRTSNGADKKDR